MVTERGVVYLVGAGPGDPGLLTLRAQELLAAADCVIYDYLLHPQILDHVSPTAQRIFVGKKGGAQANSQDEINALLIAHASPERVVVRLKGGDPFCFGRGGEEARALRAQGIPFRVVPGVTSGIAAPAYAGIPVTDRDLASSVCFLTGTEKPGSDRHDWAALARLPTLVIYMGVGQLPVIRDALLAHGKSPEVPTAAIRWGTWPHQQVISGRLADFPERLQAANFQAPAIIVIGEVAGLHRELDWCPLGPLAGRTLLVAGVQRQDPLTLGLEQAGARVIHCPGEVVELAHAEAAFPASIPSGDWLMFTSRAGVRHFMSAWCQRHGDVRSLCGVRIAVIGPSCAQELQHWHLRHEVMPAVHDSQSLCAAIAALSSAGHVWHATAVDRQWPERNALTDLGFTYASLAVYRQQHRDQLMRLASEQLDGVCLSSPSAVRRLLGHLSEDDRRHLMAGSTQFFAIGEATARLMRERGLRVDQRSDKATTPSLVDTVVAHFAPGSAI